MIMTKKESSFVILTDGQPRAVANTVKEVSNYANILTQEAAKVLGAASYTATPAYVTIARNIRDKGIFTFTIIYAGTFTSVFTIKKIVNLSKTIEANEA